VVITAYVPWQSGSLFGATSAGSYDALSAALVSARVISRWGVSSNRQGSAKVSVLFGESAV